MSERKESESTPETRDVLVFCLLMTSWNDRLPLYNTWHIVSRSRVRKRRVRVDEIRADGEALGGFRCGGV